MLTPVSSVSRPVVVSRYMVNQTPQPSLWHHHSFWWPATAGMHDDVLHIILLAQTLLVRCRTPVLVAEAEFI